MLDYAESIAERVLYGCYLDTLANVCDRFDHCAPELKAADIKPNVERLIEVWLSF
jgi:hypothetical protein